MKLTEYPLRDQTIQKTQIYAVRARRPRDRGRRQELVASYRELRFKNTIIPLPYLQQ